MLSTLYLLLAQGNKLLKIKVSIILLFLVLPVLSQVENIPVSNAVYKFLIKAEVKGILENFSSADLPLQKKEIINALINIRENQSLLSHNELSTLEYFEKEFGIKKVDVAVVFPSKTDTLSLFSNRFFSNDEKLIFAYNDKSISTKFEPLASADVMYLKSENSEDSNVLIGNLGFRLSGSIENSFGYNLQVTNGSLFSGSRKLATRDLKYGQNVKFVDLNNDVDIQESQVAYQNGWFYASIGRETRLIGSGLNQRILTSANSPAFDAITIATKFDGFEYKFSHSSLMALHEEFYGYNSGSFLEIPSKYMAFHRFSVRHFWGEIGFWESVIYTERGIDLAYINPLSFFKSLEHSLRDRDNSMMGLDWTVRPINNVQLKGTYFLDDIIFSEVGNGFWSNKAAFNIALNVDLPYSLDFGFEYARVEPYTFSHFKQQNSVTNDGRLIGSYLSPNSHSFSGELNYWYGSRYPLTLSLQYIEKGQNIYDEDGNLLVNVGSDPLQTIRPGDASNLNFLDGEKIYISNISVSTGFELMRNLNILLFYKFEILNSISENFFRIIIRVNEF